MSVTFFFYQFFSVIFFLIGSGFFFVCFLSTLLNICIESIQARKLVCTMQLHDMFLQITRSLFTLFVYLTKLVIQP